MSSTKRIACKIKMYLKQNLEMIKKEKETLVLVISRAYGIIFPFL